MHAKVVAGAIRKKDFWLDVRNEVVRREAAAAAPAAPAAVAAPANP